MPVKGVLGTVDAGPDRGLSPGHEGHDPADRRDNPDDREGEDHEEGPEGEVDQVPEEFFHGRPLRWTENGTLRGRANTPPWA